MKKHLIFWLCLTILTCVLCVPVSAEEKIDNPNYGNLSDAEIELLIKYMEDNPDFILDTIPLSISSQTFYFDSEGNRIDNMTRGAISSSAMTITIYTGKFYDPGYDYIKVSATATWNYAPIFRNKDLFAIAWGGNFAVTSYSCSTYYQTVGWKSGQSSLISATPNSGLGYSVNVNIAQTLEKVTIQADLKKVDSDGVANVVATYGHAVVDIGGIGINFSGGEIPSISFSANLVGVLDTMTKVSYFNY